MATWEDGPEYAPQQRPDAFQLPTVAPLSEPPAVAPAPPVPAEEPHFAPAESPQPELAALAPSAAPGRNPSIPFEVATAALTAGPGRPDTRSPLLPFGPPGPSLKGYLPVQRTLAPTAQVNPAPFPAPFPAPGTPQWFAPPPAAPAPAVPPSVSFGQIVTAATPGVLISLVVGAIFSWVSLLMFGLAFVLSARIAHRRQAVRKAFSYAVGAVAVVGGYSMFTDYRYSSSAFFDGLSAGAQLACWVLPVVILLIVASALRAGERPDRSLG